MEITPVGRNVEPVAPTATAVPQEAREANRDIVQAVKKVNGAELLGDNELSFQMDRDSQRMVIRLVNRKTGDIITQIPEEYVLRMAQELRRSER